MNEQINDILVGHGYVLAITLAGDLFAIKRRPSASDQQTVMDSMVIQFGGFTSIIVHLESNIIKRDHVADGNITSIWFVS